MIAASALAWSTSRRAGRIVALVLLAASIGIASIIGFAAGGRLAYDNADGPALWIEWLTSNVGSRGDSGTSGMSRLLPGFFRGVQQGTPPDAIRWSPIVSGLAWSAALAAIFAVGVRRGAKDVRE